MFIRSYLRVPVQHKKFNVLLNKTCLINLYLDSRNISRAVSSPGSEKSGDITKRKRKSSNSDNAEKYLLYKCGVPEVLVTV